MATPTFVVNSTITLYGVQSNWQRIEKRRTPDGITYHSWAVNSWDVGQMEMSSFLSLQALSGQQITSLATTAIGDRNNGATYSSGVELAIVSCQHQGVRALGVRCEFRVKV